jgi:hypothetical protein
MESLLLARGRRPTGEVLAVTQQRAGWDTISLR